MTFGGRPEFVEQRSNTAAIIASVAGGLCIALHGLLAFSVGAATAFAESSFSEAFPGESLGLSSSFYVDQAIEVAVHIGVMAVAAAAVYLAWRSTSGGDRNAPWVISAALSMLLVLTLFSPGFVFNPAGI